LDSIRSERDALAARQAALDAERDRLSAERDAAASAAAEAKRARAAAEGAAASEGRRADAAEARAATAEARAQGAETRAAAAEARAADAKSRAQSLRSVADDAAAALEAAERREAEAERKAGQLANRVARYKRENHALLAQVGAWQRTLGVAGGRAAAPMGAAVAATATGPPAPSLEGLPDWGGLADAEIARRAVDKGAALGGRAWSAVVLGPGGPGAAPGLADDDLSSVGSP